MIILINNKNDCNSVNTTDEKRGTHSHTVEQMSSTSKYILTFHELKNSFDTITTTKRFYKANSPVKQDAKS